MSKAEKLAALKADIAQSRTGGASSPPAVCSVIASIRETMAVHGLTPAHLGFHVGPRPRVPRAPSRRVGAGVARFRDPSSGKTWTGFGKPPGWIVDAENRDVFRI